VHVWPYPGPIAIKKAGAMIVTIKGAISLLPLIKRSFMSWWSLEGLNLTSIFKNSQKGFIGSLQIISNTH
jgi:hypothetical protein